MNISRPTADPRSYVGSPRLPDTDGVNLPRLAKALLKRLPFILPMLLIGAALGYGVQTAIKPRYTSSVEILIDPKRPGTFGADAVFSNLYVDSAKIASVSSIIESSDLLSQVVKSETLADDPEFGAPLDSFSHKWLGFLPFIKAPILRTDLASREARAVRRLGNALRVDRVGLTYVIQIDVTARNPVTAQRLARAVGEAYLHDQVNTKAVTTQRDSAWLESRISELRVNLTRSEAAVEAIRKQYALTETDHGPGGTVGRQVITDLNTQLIEAHADVASRQARWEEVERVRHSGGNLEGLPEVAASTVIGNLRNQQAETVRHASVLASHYGEGYPELQHAREDQRTVEVQIGAEIGRIVDRIHNEYETAIARRNALSEQLRRLTQSESSTAESEGRLQLRQAERVLDGYRGLYDSLLNRWRDVELQQTREEPEARVISEAELPDLPSSPKPLIFPAGGAVLAGVLTFVAMFLLLKLQGGFASVVDVENTLGLSVLGTIPLLRRRDLSFARTKLSIVDYVDREPVSLFAQGLRTFRVALGAYHAGGSHIIQLTSAIPGEGKSTVAAALAISAASAGTRTVIVDADVHFSTVSHLFGLEGQEGLVDIVNAGVPVRCAVQKHPNLPLTIIGAGSTTCPHPDLVSSRGFATLIKELSSAYDLVILDSPPVLGVSDALTIARVADVTLLVVGWRSTPKDIVVQAVKALANVKAPLTGVLLNKMDPKTIAKYSYRGRKAYLPESIR